jgi:hypothetical protein
MPHLHFHHRLGRLGYWCVRGSSGCRPGRRQCNGNFESGSCLAEIAFFAAGHLDVFSPIEPSALNGFRHCRDHRRRGEVIAHGFSWRGKRWGLSGTNAPTAGLRDRLSAAHTGRPSRVQQSLIISYDLSRNRLLPNGSLSGIEIVRSHGAGRDGRAPWGRNPLATSKPDGNLLGASSMVSRLFTVYLPSYSVPVNKCCPHGASKNRRQQDR